MKKFKEFIKKYFPKAKMFVINVLLSIDQFVNVLMLGDPDETISSRAGRVFPGTWWSKLIDHIMFWQTNHCIHAVEKWEGKRDILFPRIRK